MWSSKFGTRTSTIGLIKRARILIPLAISATVAAQPSGPNWDRTKPETKAICKRMGAPRSPAADLPTAAQIKAAQGCDSERLYYGEGTSRDVAKARLCAFRDMRAGNDADVRNDGSLRFRGKTILMQIYANGLGVKRDLDLATAYACQIDGAAAEIDGRVAHLQALKRSASKNFDYCDDITSGLAGGECAARQSRQQAVGRDRAVKVLLARLPNASRPFYPAVEKSFDAFVNARVGNEIDLSGTLRGAFSVEEEDKLRGQFVTDLSRLLTHQWPAATAAEAASVDAQLNLQYRKVLTGAAGADNYSTIKPDGIRAAQRNWLVYRDAYVRFATHVPGTSKAAVLTRLTRLRLAQLDKPGF